MLNHEIKTVRLDGNRWKAVINCTETGVIINRVGATKRNVIVDAERTIASRAATLAKRHTLAAGATKDTWSIYVYPMHKGLGNNDVLFDKSEGHKGEPDYWDIHVRPDDFDGKDEDIEFENLTAQQAGLVKDALVAELGFPVEDLT